MIKEDLCKGECGGVNSSVTHLIHDKNFCKCHNVPPPGTTTTKKKKFFDEEDTQIYVRKGMVLEKE
jgi:hypothetical protein